MKAQIRKYLGQRKMDTHKGDYGRVLVLAGSRGMSGACFLTSMAALRSGAGLVTVGVPKSLVGPLMRRFTDAMMLSLPETRAGSLSGRGLQRIQNFLKKQNVLAIGPGLSVHRDTQSLIRTLVTRSTQSVVLDADGLNAFKGKTDLLKKLKVPVVLTPHVGEFVRLFGGRKPKTAADRLKRALKVAREFKVVVVLKGHRTVVAKPDGKSYVNRTGNAGMATGGSGDILTGIIAAMLGQGIQAFEAACFGVYVHGLAGDRAAQKKGQISLVASDILESLPATFRKVLR